MQANEIKELKKSLEERGIKYLVTSYIDRHGVPQDAADMGFRVNCGIEAWAEFKRAEWLSYLNHVSNWERERYLRFF